MRALCIGFSTSELHQRFNNHRSEINSGKITFELVKHFHDNGCDFRKDLRVYILEDNLPLSKTSCELREDHWILKLKTKEPFLSQVTFKSKLEVVSNNLS